MTNETTITIGLLIAIVGLFITVWNFFQSYKKSIKDSDSEKDSHFDELKTSIQNMSESVLKLNFKTDQICMTTNETRTDLKAMKNDLEEMREKQIRHDMEIKAIWKKIDEMKGDGE